MSRSHRFLSVSTALLTCLAAPATARGGDPSGREIARRSEETTRLADVTAEATLTTGAAQGATRTKRFGWWRKATPQGRYHTLTRFSAPAEVNGEGVLFLEHDRDASEVLLYLPAYHKIRRVEAQSQRSSFMGSAFSYADIAAPHADDYAQRWLREEPCPGEPGVACHVVESVPGSDAVRERTGYARLVHWFRVDNALIVRADLYGLDGQLWKRLEAGDAREVDPVHHRWMQLRVRVEDVRSRQVAELRFAEVRANQGIDDALFTQQNLARDP
ncbi:MAG: outer membrane lipoprotein-sorting protein [Polyangia bacterium]